MNKLKNLNKYIIPTSKLIGSIYLAVSYSSALYFVTMFAISNDHTPNESIVENLIACCSVGFLYPTVIGLMYADKHLLSGYLGFEQI